MPRSQPGTGEPVLLVLLADENDAGLGSMPDATEELAEGMQFARDDKTIYAVQGP